MKTIRNYHEKKEFIINYMNDNGKGIKSFDREFDRIFIEKFYGDANAFDEIFNEVAPHHIKLLSYKRRFHKAVEDKILILQNLYYHNFLVRTTIDGNNHAIGNYMYEIKDKNK